MAPHPSEIVAAARALEQGSLVAFPTETVYGLGADAENPVAIARIYAAKGRPSNHPIIVHVAPDADLGYWVSALPDAARLLIDAFWPGPLTLILPRAAHIPAAVSGGQDSIGIRCPSDPVARALLRAFRNGKGGIAAPSANKFGHVSPTTAHHVEDEFSGEIGPGGAIANVLDGGPSAVGIESTIVDLSRFGERGAVLLRPGQISLAQLTDVLGRAPAMPDASAPRASGTLAAHYAPRTPVTLVASGSLHSVLVGVAATQRRVALLHWRPLVVEPGDGVVALRLPATPAGYARALYAGLRTLDAIGAALIVIEAVPDALPWEAINDRLQRAVFDSSGVLERLL